MDYQDMGSLGAELAYCEAELDEFEQEAVQHYWDQVISEELGAVEFDVAPEAWAEMGTGERALLRRQERREVGLKLRLVASAVDAAKGEGEAA